MLKLKKTARFGITLSLREKDSLFKAEILKAFFIAVLFHSTILALFQIAPFQSEIVYTFPPHSSIIR